MEKILRATEKLIPKKLYRAGQPIYHYLLSTLGAVVYGFPSKKIYVIGITGTKGKSTTSEIMNAMLEANGKKTALANTIRFKIGDNSRPNKLKMSMPGRFFMQKFLSDAVKAECDYVVLEMTSEGSKQFRTKYIYPDALLFTNLAPEHIESHGSYRKYREAKLKIVDLLQKKSGLLVVNSDDDEADRFAERHEAKNRNARIMPYSLSDAKPINYNESTGETEFRLDRTTLYTKLVGEFNVYNIVAAATLAKHMDIDMETIKKALEALSEVPGRAQKVSIGDEQQFDVIVDYAHTAESLEALYTSFPEKKKVCILGNTGGGRDKWKRPAMAQTAEKYCDEIILTNEDPYDEDPEQIVKEMNDALVEKKAEIIMDRREAINTGIRKAVESTDPANAVVLITGKGTDPFLMEADGKKTPWSDYDVAKEELGKVLL